MNRHGGSVAKAGGSKGHALHDGSRSQWHAVGHIPHSPYVIYCCPGILVNLDGIVLIKSNSDLLS